MNPLFPSSSASSFPRRGFRRLAFAVGTGLSVVVSSCTPGEGAPQFLSIGTGGTGGIYYPLGGAIASGLTERDSLRQYTAEVTGGSVENVNRVNSGQIDLGFTLAITAFNAYEGSAGETPAMDDLRVIAPLYPNLVHVMVREAAGIQTVADFAGRRVSVGAPGSGTEQMAQQILDAYGLDYEQMTVQYLSFRESAAALRDGALDAAILSVGFPAAAVLEATTGGGVTLIPVAGDGARSLIDRYPYYAEGSIPPGVYAGIDAAVPTLAMSNWIVGRSDLDDSVVRHLLDLLSEDRDGLAAVNDMARQIDLARLAEAPIPVHSAAGSYRSGG